MLNFIRAMENAEKASLEEEQMVEKKTEGSHSFINIPELAALVKQTPSCHEK